MELSNVLSLFAGKSEDGPGMIEQIKQAGQSFEEIRQKINNIEAMQQSMDSKLDAILSLLRGEPKYDGCDSSS